MSKVKNLTTRLLLNPHFQLLAFQNYFTILPYTKKELALIPFPIPDLPRGSHDAPILRIECPSPTCAGKAEWTFIPKAKRTHPEGIPKAKRMQSERSHRLQPPENGSMP